MKKILVCVVSLLFYASVVPIIAEMSEITEARIAGENDAKGFHWQRKKIQISWQHLRMSAFLSMLRMGS